MFCFVRQTFEKPRNGFQMLVSDAWLRKFEPFTDTTRAYQGRKNFAVL
jgi:hypothetical protein